MDKGKVGFFQKIRDAKKKNKVTNSKILVNGLLVTCLVLSVASGFVDLVFFSGISVSNFHIGTLLIAASIVYVVISIGLILMKFWCAMKIGMLQELRMKLKSYSIKWSGNITKALVPWHIAHKILIMISLITAMSMSVNSIGFGIRKMQQNINNMTSDAEQLIELNNSVNSGVKNNRDAKKDSIMSTKTAQDDAKKEVEKYWNLLDEYQTEIRSIRKDDSLTDKEKTEKINKIKTEAVQSLPVITLKNVEYLSKSEFEQKFSEITKKNESAGDVSGVYKEAIEYDKSQIEDTLRAIADKEYKHPDGTPIEFLDDEGNPINVQLAISRLQQGISEWQNDTGDVGESSKVFTLVSTYIHADEKAGGMGTSEWMMIIFIFIVGVTQEFCIKLSTPSATIDRETLGSVSKYCEWKSEDEKLRFLLKVYKGYADDGVFSEDIYHEKCKEIVELMNETEDDIIEMFSKKKKRVVIIPDIKPKIVKELPKTSEKKPEPKIEEKKEEEIIEEKKEVEHEVIDQPKKMIIKSAEKQLEEMINESEKK